MGRFSRREILAGTHPSAPWELAVEPRFSFKAVNVVEVLSKPVKTRGAARAIRCDNGPEFVSRILDQWAYWNKVELDFSRPGRPTDNAFIGSFSGGPRRERLNTSWFLSLPDAKYRLEDWRKEYHVPRGSASQYAGKPDPQRVHISRLAETGRGNPEKSHRHWYE